MSRKSNGQEKDVPADRLSIVKLGILNERQLAKAQKIFVRKLAERQRGMTSGSALQWEKIATYARQPDPVYAPARSFAVL